jgi:hypothetical protein
MYCAVLYPRPWGVKKPDLGSKPAGPLLSAPALARTWPAGVASGKPGLQHLDLPPATVGLAHRRERLRSGRCPWARERIQSSQSKLCLSAGQPLFAA